MRRNLAGIAALLMLASGVAVAAGRLQAADLTVTVTYAGKGAVDANNDLLVFLFDHPNVTAQSQPLAVQSITKNGGAATFKGVQTPTVYVLSVYDEKANYDGLSGPPPPGTPIGTYGRDGKALAVEPAKTPKVTLKFDDSRRWK